MGRAAFQLGHFGLYGFGVVEEKESRSCCSITGESGADRFDGS
jgi:hypothetical protein